MTKEFRKALVCQAFIFFVLCVSILLGLRESKAIELKTIEDTGIYNVGQLTLTTGTANGDPAQFTTFTLTGLILSWNVEAFNGAVEFEMRYTTTPFVSNQEVHISSRIKINSGQNIGESQQRGLMYNPQIIIRELAASSTAYIRWTSLHKSTGSTFSR